MCSKNIDALYNLSKGMKVQLAIGNGNLNRADKMAIVVDDGKICIKEINLIKISSDTFDILNFDSIQKTINFQY